MQLIAALASAAALVAPSMALVIPDVVSATGLPQYYHWNVTGWNAGCARAGCTYNFNVTGHQDGVYPGFLAYCSGTDVGYFESCDIVAGVSTSGTPSASASLQPSVQDGNAHMAVSLSFVDADSQITYNVTGTHTATFNAFVGPNEDFSIFTKQMKVTQVA